MNNEEIISEISKNNGVTIGKDDPILMLNTVAQAYANKLKNAQQQDLSLFKSELQMIMSQWQQSAEQNSKAYIDNIINTSNTTYQKITNISNETINKVVNISIDVIENHIKTVLEKTLNEHVQKIENTVEQTSNKVSAKIKYTSYAFAITAFALAITTGYIIFKLNTL